MDHLPPPDTRRLSYRVKVTEPAVWRRCTLNWMKQHQLLHNILIPLLLSCLVKRRGGGGGGGGGGGEEGGHGDVATDWSGVQSIQLRGRERSRVRRGRRK